MRYHSSNSLAVSQRARRIDAGPRLAAAPGEVSEGEKPVSRPGVREVQPSLPGSFDEEESGIHAPRRRWSELSRLLRQISIYAVVGGLAFVVDFALLYALVEQAGLHYLMAAALAFLGGLVVNYLASTRWVFVDCERRSRGVELGGYALIGVVGLGWNELLLWGLTAALGTHYVTAKVLTAAFVFFWNFFARKYALFA